MLRELEVRNFAVVDRAEINFGHGLTVVTGETGAGKSLLVDALMLLAGSRADSAVVRAGAERAEVHAAFALDKLPAAAEWLDAQALDDDGECRLRRVISAEGGSRAWINGRPAGVGQLAELGALLVEIHGQHAHQAMLQRASQLDLLDRFGGHEPLRAKLASLVDAWREASAQLAALTGGEDRAERLDFLRHQVAELEAESLAPEALAELGSEHGRLANAGSLIEGCGKLAEALDGEHDFALLRLLHRAHGDAARLGEMDAGFAPVAELLEQAAIQLDEANDSLVRRQSLLELDPERLAAIDQQLSRLHELSRKHRVPVAELAECAAGLRAELDALDGAGEEIRRLRGECERLEREYAGQASELGTARGKSARKLGKQVSALMAELGMAGGSFAVDLEPTGRNEPDAHGKERAEFLVSANPGQPPRPLRKVASGGELSRIALAIEVATLGMDPVGTMVFDEVDAGIGGAVAEVVGQKLRRLGSSCQVLCVTHLPQVAAQGHAHLKVEKSSKSGSTQTQVGTLDDVARRVEIARMLGGIEITAETRSHAEQMLDRAQAS